MMKRYKLPSTMGGHEFEAGEFHMPNSTIGRWQYRGPGFALWFDTRLAEVSPLVEDWGARLERIFTRHVGDGNGRCMWCDHRWPCADRKDAGWTP